MMDVESGHCVEEEVVIESASAEASSVEHPVTKTPVDSNDDDNIAAEANEPSTNNTDDTDATSASTSAMSSEIHCVEEEDPEGVIPDAKIPAIQVLSIDTDNANAVSDAALSTTDTDEQSTSADAKVSVVGQQISNDKDNVYVVSDAAPSINKADENDETTASPFAISSSDDISEVSSVKKHRAPSPPRWRFVKEAKKSAGYDSTAAGTYVRGQSSEELGAVYVPPVITLAEKVKMFEVGQLSAPDITYSKFQKEERQVGRLSIDNSVAESEELYGGGVVISHDPKKSLHKDKPFRKWASWQPRSKDSKQTRDYEKDKYTNLIETEDRPNRKFKGVGRLKFCPDDYLGEAFDGEIPRRKLDKSLYSSSQLGVEAGPKTNDSDSQGSGSAKSVQDEDGRVDLDDELSSKGDLSEDSSTLQPRRRRKLWLFLLLIPLLIIAAVVGVVLGKKESSSEEEGTRVFAVAGAALPNATIQPSTQPSSFDSDSGLPGGGLFDVNTAVVLTNTGQPSTSPTTSTHGLFNQPHSSLVPIIDLSAPPTAAPNQKQAIPTVGVSLFGSTTQPTQEPVIFVGGCPAQFTPRTPYDIGTQVQSQGIVYECISAFGCGSYGFEPGSSSSNLWQEKWEVIGSCDGTIAPSTSVPTISEGLNPPGPPLSTPQPSISEGLNPPVPPGTTNEPLVKPSQSPTHSPSQQTVAPSKAPSTQPVTPLPTSQPIVSLGGCPQTFVTSSLYSVGDQVQLQGIVYQCNDSFGCGSFGFEPGSATGLWKEKWIILGSCSGSMAPTSLPTQVPTRPPSQSPTTLNPTPLPSQQPSQQPSAPPSRAPVVVTSQSIVTTSPTWYPSSSPSSGPTTKPTALPTTASPITSSPTNSPNSSPSRVPTNMPTAPPTTPGPSKAPSSSPSRVPTDEPTTSPSRRPSELPTAAPFKAPSSQPSKSPSNRPTLDPTDVPTESPSSEPMPTPSLDPTHTPSFDPTPFPSLDPTVNPTFEPTQSPTPDPTPPPTTPPPTTPPPTTPFPTSPPTLKPTNIPEPTRMPSSSPTLRPTCEENGNFNLCVAMDMSGSVCNDATSSLCLQCDPQDICLDNGLKPTVCCNNWSNIVEFTKSLVTGLGELPTEQDFSLVHFGTDVNTASTLQSWRQAVKTMNQLKYSGGKTNLAGAIDSCQTTLAQSPPDRSNIMLIITDGAPSVPDFNPQGVATTAATNSKNLGTFIIPVLIEDPNFSFAPEVTFLKNNISSDGKVFVADFNGLSSIQDSVFDQVTCQANV